MQAYYESNRNETDTRSNPSRLTDLHADPVASPNANTDSGVYQCGVHVMKKILFVVSTAMMLGFAVDISWCCLATDGVCQAIQSQTIQQAGQQPMYQPNNTAALLESARQATVDAQINQNYQKQRTDYAIQQNNQNQTAIILELMRERNNQ